MPEDMTLRDLFAAAAMAGDLCSHLGHIDEEEQEDYRSRARVYYRMADAMLQIRKGNIQQFPSS